MVTFFRRRREILWRVEQYRGQRSVVVQATQLESVGVTDRSEQRSILTEWTDFLRDSTTRIVKLDLVSRVPQELLDAVGGQRHVTALSVKWGPYSDLNSMSSLQDLRTLSLGGASAVESLQPLTSLRRLRSLLIDQPFAVRDLEVIGRLRSLENLVVGNGHPSSNRVLDVADLDWIGQLTKLRTLRLPGTRLPAAQLAAFARLPYLDELSIPLRREYEQAVFDLASANKALARLAREFERLGSARSFSASAQRPGHR